MKRYRIRRGEYAAKDPFIPMLYELHSYYSVQVRTWFGWVSVKEFEDVEDDEFAKREAEELLAELRRK